VLMRDVPQLWDLHPVNQRLDMCQHSARPAGACAVPGMHHQPLQMQQYLSSTRMKLASCQPVHCTRMLYKISKCLE
jgi:hypothetical protein